MSDTTSSASPGAAGTATLRLDKWLWHARLFRTRSLATRFCSEGRIRIGGRVIDKAHYAVKPGDVLTFAHGREVKVLKIVALGLRRGPAPEAQRLYEDLGAPRAVVSGTADSNAAGSGATGPGATAPADIPPAQRARGSGRPTKAERRATDRLTRED